MHARRECCDTTAAQMHDRRCPVLYDKVESAYAAILWSTAPQTINDEGMAATPRRAATAWFELTAGYDTDVAGLFTTFDADGYDEMVAVCDVPFTSLCEHHLLPFVGTASVVYLPDRRIVGLSKIPRVIRAFAARLQNQERLTMEIADALDTHLAPLGVLVVCDAHHTCMSARGARSEGRMRTSVTRGAMRTKPESRAEALALIERGAT